MNTRITDYLNSAGFRQESVVAAFRLIDQLQDFQGGTQLQALAIMLHLVTDHYGVNKADVLGKAERLLADLKVNRPEHFRAIAEYIKGELK